MAAYRRVDDLQSPAGWLPVHRDQLQAQHSVSSIGKSYLYRASTSSLNFYRSDVLPDTQPTA